MPETEIPTESEQARKRWWWALRRAYEVPDIVTDEKAWNYLSYVVCKEDPASSAGEDFPIVVGERAMSLVFKVAASGDLDYVVLSEKADIRMMCQAATEIGGPLADLNKAALETATEIVERLRTALKSKDFSVSPPMAVMLKYWS